MSGAASSRSTCGRRRTARGARRAVSFYLGTTGALLAGGGVALSVTAAGKLAPAATVGLAILGIFVAGGWLTLMYVSTPAARPAGR